MIYPLAKFFKFINEGIGDIVRFFIMRLTEEQQFKLFNQTIELNKKRLENAQKTCKHIYRICCVYCGYRNKK
jgi:hypothetical protein